jgi:hypothetical protein
MKSEHHQVLKLSCCIVLSLLSRGVGPAAEPAKAPVPKSPYIAVVYRYADTLLERGRDISGARRNGLVLSALDRNTLAPLTNRPPAPHGIREEDRVGSGESALAGMNPQHDQNLLRLLYVLSELTLKPKYRQAADSELKWFLQNTNSFAPAVESLFRPWMLWSHCFELAPEVSRQVARASLAPEPDRTDFPRTAGFRLRAWAEAYVATRDADFLTRIEKLLDRLEQQSSWKREGGDSPERLLSLAVDATGASRKVPEPLATRLEAVASQVDDTVLADSEARRIRHPAERLWSAPDGQATIARTGMMYVSRYDNTGKMVYRSLLVAAADAYLSSLPEKDADAWPGTFGQAINLEIAAWRHTAKPIYLECARKLADWSMENFWGTNALPRASLKSDHYETITGADTLALALLELHLQVLHITAARCPANSIDR